LSPSPEDPNRAMLSAAIEKLLPLLDRIVFVGGCATGLLVTDPAAAPVRATIDVDVIPHLTTQIGYTVTELFAAGSPPSPNAAPFRSTDDVDAVIEHASYAEYMKLGEQLRQLGFRECQDEGAPVCRWVSHDLILDVMPTNSSVLGFSNRWYRAAFQNAQEVSVQGHTIRLITAPYFLATKLETFHSRGKEDYRGSHDLEDIVTVLDGRPEIEDEVGLALPDLRQYLSDEFRALTSNRDFRDALPGHLLPDDASQQRIGPLIERMKNLILEG
jgi:hypothetical protein